MHTAVRRISGTPVLNQRPLVRAVAVAILGMAIVATVSASAHAQQAPLAENAIKSYNIPAGPLSQVLYSFAASAGITLSFEPNVTDGLRSNGLQGNYSVQRGLSSLLAAHNIEAVPGDNGYRLRRVVQDASTLPAVSVTSSSVREATSEGTRSYSARAITVGKTSQSLRETPQPVTVLTRQFMEDRGLQDLTEVLQNTPGVTVDYTDSERLVYTSRGYTIDALQVDGLTFSQSGSAFVQPDTAVLDRVEVLRGASGMIRGSGNPSATVNMVRKRPTADFKASAALTLGSWDRRRLEADISGSLNDAGTLRGRLVAVDDDKEFFQKGRTEHKQVLYGVVEADISPRTTWTTSFQYTDLDASGAWGNLPSNYDGSSLNLPRSTYLGAAWNRWDRYNTQTFTEIEHRFDNDWKLKLNAAYTQFRLRDFKQSYITPIRTVGGTNPYLATATQSHYIGAANDQLSMNVLANGPFNLLGRRHELIIGAETIRNKATDSHGVGSQYSQTIDIRDWNPYTTYAERDLVITAAPNKPNTTSQQAIFGTARFSITDPLTVLVGTRISWWDYKSAGTPANNYKVTREITPYAGLIYDLSRNISAYASYTEIFTPQNEKNQNGELLQPVRGETFEAGLKGEFFNRRLNASAGIFQITNVGKAVQDTSTVDPCTPYYTSGYCRIAGGKTRSEGWEMEVSGEVAPNWQMSAGYTNTRTRYITDSTAANVGQPLRTIDPRHQLRVFSTYRFGGETQGWTVGGGAQMQSDSYVNGTLTLSGPTTRVPVTARQGGYTVYNAMASYRFNKDYSVQINVNNLFDKVYYKKFAPTGIGYYYGDPRNVMVSFRANF